MTIVSPWVEYYRELEALFAQDKEVKVVFDDEAKEVKLLVDNGRKADALAKLLPAEQTFGNVTLKVAVVPSNEEETTVQLLEDAFHNNPALVCTMSVPTPFGDIVDYAVFEGRVVQYKADNMADPYGTKSTLYQDIARDVFGERAAAFFCTEPVQY